MPAPRRVPQLPEPDLADVMDDAQAEKLLQQYEELRERERESERQAWDASGGAACFHDRQQERRSRRENGQDSRR